MTQAQTAVPSDPLAQARANAIAQQIRPWDVLDPRVIEALESLRREDFLPEADRSLAYVDTDLPLPEGQTMLAPKLQARLVQEADLQPTDEVLEIGTGTGYSAALLSRLCRQVTTVEKQPALAEMAKANLAKAGIENVSVLVGNGLSVDTIGAGRSFDAILVSGGLREVPRQLLDLLKPGGRLIAIVGEAPIMRAVMLEKQGTTVMEHGLFETMVPLMEDIPQPNRFQF